MGWDDNVPCMCKHDHTQLQDLLPARATFLLYFQWGGVGRWRSLRAHACSIRRKICFADTVLRTRSCAACWRVSSLFPATLPPEESEPVSLYSCLQYMSWAHGMFWGQWSIHGECWTRQASVQYRKMLLYTQLSVRIKRSMWTWMTQGSVLPLLIVCRMLMIDCWGQCLSATLPAHKTQADKLCEVEGTESCD